MIDAAMNGGIKAVLSLLESLDERTDSGSGERIMPQRDYYEILQVSPDADDEVIRAAYRALTKKYHPDAGRPAASGDMMVTINEAIAVLSDPKLRSDYDKSRLQEYRSQSSAFRKESADKELIFSSNFSTSSGPMAERFFPGGSMFARNGTFFMQVLPGCYLYSGMIGPVGDCEIQVELQTTVHTLNSEDELDEDAVSAGVMFRQSEDKGYLYRVERNGYYRLDSWSSIAFTPIYEGYSEALQCRNGSNLLNVRAVGPWITLTVNGSIVAVIEDSSSMAGSVALFAECDDGETAGTARFRNFFVYSVKESSPQTELAGQKMREAMLQMKALAEAKEADDRERHRLRRNAEMKREMEALVRAALGDEAREKPQSKGCGSLFITTCGLIVFLGSLTVLLV
jgi:curved DNA-binding protein CbpA